MTGSRASRLLLAAALALAPLLLLAPPAHAATVTISLTDTGPSPADVTVRPGDVVRFANTGNTSHQVTDNGTNWSFDRTIAPGASATTSAFATAGAFRYTDSFTVVLPQSSGGTISVVAATPSATPTASPTPRPTVSPTPRATVSPTPRASTAPTPAPSGTGTAVVPGLGVQQSASPTPRPTGVPAPSVAPPSAAAGPAPAGSVLYGDKRAVVQGSPHRYGLPGALAVVAIVGIVSLLVRYLLAVGTRA